MPDPVISIVIPHFNRGELIGRTIDSILAQSWPHFECLIIDDHSTDESYAQIASRVADDPRFILRKRQKPVKGAPVCRNEGIRLATGTYLFFLDSDDLLAPWCLEQRVKLFGETPGKDFIVTQTGLFRKNTGEVRHLHNSLEHEDDLEAFLNMEGWGTSSPTYRTGFVKQRSWDEQALSWQDIEFHIRLLLDAPEYIKFPSSRPDVFKRFGTRDQISATNQGIERLESLLRLFLRLEKRLAEADVRYQESFLWYYFKFLEIAARTESPGDFQALKALWRNSATSRLPRAKILRTYLSTQALLTKFGMYKVGSACYRMIRLTIPDQALNFSGKHVKLEPPVRLNELNLS